MRTPRFTFVSEGKPRRRLLIGLKGLAVFEVEILHDAPRARKGICQEDKGLREEVHTQFLKQAL